jgi:hypothetical protein
VLALAGFAISLVLVTQFIVRGILRSGGEPLLRVHWPAPSRHARPWSVLSGDAIRGVARAQRISPGRSQAWDEERVDAALCGFLAARAEWPSYREFARAGEKSLRDAVTRLGGAELWARRVGIEYRRRPPGYAPRWTEERIRRELAEFVGDGSRWPSSREFEEAGRGALRRAVTRTGGAQRWAGELGIATGDRRTGSRRRWTPEEIELAVRPLVRRLQRWPTKAEFATAGLSSALTAMYRFEGIDEWRRRLGEPVRSSRATGPRVWTDARLEQELREFCAGRDDWPTEREFLRDGRGRLYRAASLHGGVGAWRRRLGLAPPQRRAPRRSLS